MTVLITRTAALRSGPFQSRAVQIAGSLLATDFTIYGSRVACTLGLSRGFSNTSPTYLKPKKWFPPPDDSKIKYTPAAWKHPIYSKDHLESIKVTHREARTWQDGLALRLMQCARWCMDRATGYTEKSAHLDAQGKLVPNGFFIMDERKWLIRIVFLESIAGVPGMVAGMLRHLRSLRQLKRDNAWIEDLLEESYNERMHLLTFMKIAEPGWFMKAMIIGAQGVFFNSFFLAYLIAPATCHRFVGYLEEEAVYTYSRIIAEYDAGKLPEWKPEKFQIPDIAVQYWDMKEGQQTMRDLLEAVRLDEAKHRELNHTFANLHAEDPNPFNSDYYPGAGPHPSKGFDTMRPMGWERHECVGVAEKEDATQVKTVQ